MIDINKKLQDKANEVVNNATDEISEILDIPEDRLDKFLDLTKGLVAMSMKAGFVMGCQSIISVGNVMLNDAKGEGK